MSAATFVLAINLCVAGIFATSFAVVAFYARSAISARWLAAAYGLGVISPVLEFVLPFQSDARPVGIGIFAAFLFALVMSVFGLARHYRVPPPWRALLVVVVVSLITNVLTIDMERSSVLRSVLYQLPYAVLQGMGVWVILRAARRQALDLLLACLYTLGGMSFLFKPLLAASIGSGSKAQAYIGTDYAAISQSSGAVLLVANGLLMLLIILRDSMADMTERSETDALSGLLNRRGFERRGEQLLARARRLDLPVSLLVADLDRFKTINDNHGHDAGDRVIMAFAQVLRAHADSGAVIGRLGGEEFAVLMPQSSASAGEQVAHAVRHAFSEHAIGAQLAEQRLSVSLGVAQRHEGETLGTMMRRADGALYRAKNTGRDRVCVATPEQD